MRVVDARGKPVGALTIRGSRLYDPGCPGSRPFAFASALGAGVPSAGLRVSPQHRKKVRSIIAAQTFGTGEILVPPIRLTGLPSISTETDFTRLPYVHLLFGWHEMSCPIAPRGNRSTLAKMR